MKKKKCHSHLTRKLAAPTPTSSLPIHSLAEKIFVTIYPFSFPLPLGDNGVSSIRVVLLAHIATGRIQQGPPKQQKNGESDKKVRTGS